MVEPNSETPPGKHPPPRLDGDRQREQDLELLARWMDSVFRIPGVGMRFGLDALVGLIPGVGDTLTSLVSLYILGSAARFGVPRVTLLRMALNIGVDWALGLLPVLGDVFDVGWKANQKNVALLRRHIIVTPVEERRARAGDWLFVGGLIAGLLALLAGCLATAFFIASWLAQALFAPAR